METVEEFKAGDGYDRLNSVETAGIHEFRGVGIMELKGTRRIGAHRDRVWSLINDVDIVRSCIPGCETLAKDGDNKLTVSIRVNAGPVIALFNGQAVLSHVVQPERFTISGEGHGGNAGLIMGEADISLVPDGSETELNYTLKADVGGRLAKIGSSLLEATAQRYANDFIGRFTDIARQQTSSKKSINDKSEDLHKRDLDSGPGSSDSRGNEQKNNSKPLLWIIVGVIFLLGLILIFR